MNVARDVELAELLVERIPVAIAHRRRLDSAVLERIRVDQRADEAELGDAAFELRDRIVHRLGGDLRQRSDADEPIRPDPALLMGNVIAFLGEHHDDLGRALRVHHLIRPRREQLNVRAGLVHIFEVPFDAMHRRAAAFDVRFDVLGR